MLAANHKPASECPVADLFSSLMSFINHLSSVGHLRNRYVAVRHGESEANVAHLISSHAQRGVQLHGLSDHGRSQVLENTRSFLAHRPSDESYRLISSDFRRARETAEILAGHLPTKQSSGAAIELDPRLRERFFGIYDNTSDEHYELIWRNDRDDPERNRTDQVESGESVRDRTSALVKELEDKYDDQTIFLVSHGDSLQILQTAFERMPNVNQQRQLTHLERAEFRLLRLK